MMDKVVMLPSVPRPAIYAIDRGGTWTIDENRAFVPFGGDFPSNLLFDKIARDPETGRFVGVNARNGVFALDPGEKQFKKLYASGESSLRHPYSVEFIPRFSAFVIADPNGLYLLDRRDGLKQLPVVSRTGMGIPFTVFDLPAFKALLINADMQGPTLVVRYDDGEAVLPATLKPFDFVRSVTVEAGGDISVHTQFDHRTIRLSRTPSEPIIQGNSFVVNENHAHVAMDRLEAPSIGKVIVNDPKSGLTELASSGSESIALPFDPAQEPIEGMVEIPEYKAVLILTRASAYALQDNGAVSEVRGAREAGVSPLTASHIRLIPVRNETIFLGRNTLNLLVDTRISGEASCDLAYVRDHG